MASPRVASPFANFFRDTFRGGGRPQRLTNQPRAPLERRPVANPAASAGPPGPAPLEPIVTPGAEQAQARSQQRRGRSRRQMKRLRGQQYGRSGGTQGDPGSIEDQIRKAMTGMFEGQTSRAFIDRAKQALGGAVEGQRAQAVRRIDDDAIRRGLFRSGIPSGQAAAAGTAAQGAFSQGLADILSQAEQQDIQGRQFATGQAQQLLGSNRAYDQYLQQQIERARGRGGGGPGTQTIIDPDTGQPYEIESSLLRYL